MSAPDDVTPGIDPTWPSPCKCPHQWVTDPDSPTRECIRCGEIERPAEAKDVRAAADQAYDVLAEYVLGATMSERGTTRFRKARDAFNALREAGITGGSLT